MVLTDGDDHTSINQVMDASLISEDMRKLFVTKIPKDCADDELKTFFEEVCGGSVSALVVIRKETAKNHFGFITFESSSLVDEAIYKEKELVINGNSLEVNRACPKEQYLTGAHHRTKKLFITGIPKTGLVEEELKDYFDSKHDPRYGTVKSIEFVKKKDLRSSGGENKGYGFMTVSSEHLADTMSIQHSSFEFKGCRLQLKKSDRDGKPNEDLPQRGSRGDRRGARQWGYQSQHSGQDLHYGKSYQYTRYDGSYNDHHSRVTTGASGHGAYAQRSYDDYYNRHSYPHHRSSSSTAESIYTKHRYRSDTSRYESARGFKGGSRVGERHSFGRDKRYAPYLKKTYSGS